MRVGLFYFGDSLSVLVDEQDPVGLCVLEEGLEGLAEDGDVFLVGGGAPWLVVRRAAGWL